jgi:hypothetical protein
MSSRRKLMICVPFYAARCALHSSLNGWMMQMKLQLPCLQENGK